MSVSYARVAALHSPPMFVRADPGHGHAITITNDGGEFAVLSHGQHAMSVFAPEDGRILEVNDAWVKLYGWSREDAHRMKVGDVSAEPAETMKAVSTATASGGLVIDLRWHRRRDGVVFPVELSSGTIRVGDRTIMFAVMQDITDRRRAETALANSELRLRAIFESLPDAVLVHRDGKILYHNQSFARMHGFDADDSLVGRSIADLVHRDDLPSANARIRAAAEDGLPQAPRETMLLCRDGTTLPAEIRGIRIEYGGEPAVLAIARDLRQQRSMEARLLLADRLAALGRLAASVGHEINNPIAYMMGTLELFRREMESMSDLSGLSRDRLLQRVAVLEDGARRVRDIVRDLKALTVSGGRVVGPVDVHRVIDLCANMAEHELRHRARLVREYGAPLLVEADEARLAQVFLNLLINASQAIDAGAPEENEIRVSTSADGDGWLVVEVRDTGRGIPSALRERVFEPFFTTREDAGGTGLGLSISHSIVSAYGGTIALEPNEPRGTCVRVRLPRAQDG